MTAPTATNRVAPVGTHLKDGYQSLVTFAADPNVSLWETEIGSPDGDDGGDPVDLTTMHNTTRMTKGARGLIDTENGSMTCGYATTARAQCRALINVETVITVTFADGTQTADYGYMKSFKPTGLTNGEMPLADVEFVFTGRDTSGNEEEPVTV